MTALNHPNSGPQETLRYDPMGNLSSVSSTLCTSGAAAENRFGDCLNASIRR